ncbi:hypothetical protein [Ralstonia phage RpY2]|uniref:Uncharacterized protein n=1 Tax=Ralstonia phage RpY2 TaxID=2880950 RepID=A0AC61TNE1_9CAUD|nr:hypothetical protein [Ralstonia phage RpY2]
MSEQAIRINVAKKQPKPGWDGKPTFRHHCAVNLDWLSDLDTVHEVVQQLRLAFPVGEYHISVTRWGLKGERIKVEGCDDDR